MPNRDTVRTDVIGVLSEISKYSAASIQDDHRLWMNLRIGKIQKAGLAPRFNNLLTTYGGGGGLTASQMEKLKTVKDCIDLVCQSIGGCS